MNIPKKYNEEVQPTYEKKFIAFYNAIKETHNLNDAVILANNRGYNWAASDINTEAWHDARLESGREQ